MTLDGRFEITDLVARSNMASIFKARDRQTGEAVAIKVPLMTLESDVAGFERFQREEEIGTRLQHPGVLKVIKVEEKKSRPYLVMEFLDGETLADLLNRKQTPAGAGSRALRQPDMRGARLPACKRRSPTAISSPRTSCSAATAACGCSTSESPASKRRAA